MIFEASSEEYPRSSVSTTAVRCRRVSDPNARRTVSRSSASSNSSTGSRVPIVCSFLFGPAGAARIMANIVRLTYDGKTLPAELRDLRPRFLLEAIPEILEVKKAHYALFRSAFPGIEIRSVTSGFPARELGVGVAHPAFPHEINKVFETVEEQPSDITRLLWALGLIPTPVGDSIWQMKVVLRLDSSK